MAYWIDFACGLLFGVGLILAGMSNPAKVLAFLDFAGKWDPSLALVMVGAIAVAALGWPAGSGAAAGRGPDLRLLLGSALFGVGWGLAGFCPGPAIVDLGAGYLPAVVFCIALVFGVEAHAWLLAAEHRRSMRSRNAGA